MNDFIDIKISYDNLDKFYIRRSIFQALTTSLPQFKGKLLDIGCGKMPYRNYILENSQVDEYTGLDIENALIYDAENKPDATWDGITMPFENEGFDSAIGTEVLEHCPEPEVLLKEVYRVLKPGGVFFFTVPFLWNLHEVPHDAYRYTPFALERHLKNVGFEDIVVNATGGWHASMAQMLGLWVRRSPMTNRKRTMLSRLIKPIMKRLLKADSSYDGSFREGQMVPGLTGIARK